VKRALALSPHLGDAVFSAGATLGVLAAEGWEVTLATVFTLSVPAPRGFALRCQTDQGIAAEIDYMALRRAEDRRAARVLGIERVLHLPWPEAPHRGYVTPGALFGALRAGDRVAVRMRPALAGLGRFDLVLAPLGLGGHVDHRQLLRALEGVRLGPVVRWRDLPYALRAAEGGSAVDAAGLPGARAVAVGAALPAKLAACGAYASQLGFRFGGEAAMRRTLAAHAAAEGRRAGVDGPAERFAGAEASGLDLLPALPPAQVERAVVVHPPVGVRAEQVA